MPATPHVEKHFTATETVRDVVIGMADELSLKALDPNRPIREADILRQNDDVR
jgi:hypothetical protein